MDAQDADRALGSVLGDLEATSTTDIASNPHNAICKIMVALVLIGRRLVPARSSATDETMPGKRGTFRPDPPRAVVRDRVEGRDADLAAKDRAELAAALTKLETAERTVATLQNLLAERDREIDRRRDTIEKAREMLIGSLGAESNAPALAVLVGRACRRIAVLLDEHQRERTEVDKLRSQVAAAEKRADENEEAHLAMFRSQDKQHAEQAAELRKLVSEAQVERDMAVNEMCEWRNAHARARLAAWEILHPGVPLKGDRTLAQLLDDVREAMAEARNENERADDLVEHVLWWYQHHAAQDEHDAKLRAAVDEWSKEPAEAGPLLADKLATADARWERIQPLIRALHAWEKQADGDLGGALPYELDMLEAFEAWQKEEANALDAEEAKPTPALRSLLGGPPVHVDEPAGAFADVQDGPVDLPRQPDDPGVEP